MIEKKSKFSLIKTILIRWIFSIIFFLILIIIFAPFLLRLYGDIILPKMFFQTWSRYYPWIDLTKPDDFHLNGVNIYEQTEDNVNIGIWYILPLSVKINPNLLTLADHLKEYVRSKDRPLIIYLHGQDGTTTHYRTNHYRVMSAFDNHIITLDYRGYGDSTGTPSVHGVVHDVLYVFQVIRQVCPENPITIWGHSMGTGVALWTMKKIFQNETNTNLKKPSGLVIEAPFFNTMEGLISYPLTRILKINPYFMQTALDALANINLDFPNNEIISFIPLPIIIFHSEDDAIIPYHHTQLIEKYIETHRNQNLPPIRLVTVPRSAHCGHNHIYSYPKFQEIVSNFPFLKRPSAI